MNCIYGVSKCLLLLVIVFVSVSTLPSNLVEALSVNGRHHHKTTSQHNTTTGSHKKKAHHRANYSNGKKPVFAVLEWFSARLRHPRLKTKNMSEFSHHSGIFAICTNLCSDVKF